MTTPTPTLARATVAKESAAPPSVVPSALTRGKLEAALRAFRRCDPSTARAILERFGTVPPELRPAYTRLLLQLQTGDD